MRCEPEEIDADEIGEVVQRVAAIDVAKASGKVCTRVPHPSIAGRRVSKVWDVGATTSAVMELADELARQRIERVVVESTGDYWRIWYYLLEARGLLVWLVNARDVKNVPGRAKTDLLTELPQGFQSGCVPGGVRLARFAARDGRWRTAAGFGGAGGAGSGWSGGDRRPVPAVSAG
jgi:Transposase